MEHIKLNLVPSDYTKPICHASQYDNGRKIGLDLYDGQTPYILSNETIELDVKKLDGNIVTTSLEVIEGQRSVVLVTTEQMCAIAGKNLCELKIQKDGTTIYSKNFYLAVEESATAGGIQSTSEINNLETQIEGMVEDAVENQYDSENVIFDSEPTEGHGTGYTVTSEGIKAAIDAAGGNVIDDTRESATKTWSSEKINETKTRVDDTTEGGASKNLYPTNLLKNATGISYNNGVFSGSATDFYNAPALENVFKENTRYTAQATVKRVSGSTTTSNGLTLRLLYSDGTYSSGYVPNDTTEFTKFTLTSGEGKNVVGFKFTYVSGGSNGWEVKEVQVEEGEEATSWVSPDASTLTAIDKVARAGIDKMSLLPWWSRFQNEFLRIAYSAIWVDKINTATHWLFAADMGFNVLKGDVEITSDGELVMCHDAGFTFDENGRIINYNANNNTLIKDMTYAECRSKVYADNPSRYGGYCPVADVDDFIRICKDKGKICFLTIRATNTASVVAKAVEKIKYYGMESRTILNAVQATIIDAIRANHDADGIAINFVAPEGTAITTAQVDKCLEWGNAFLSIWADGVTSVIDNSATAIAYAKEKGVPLLAAVSGDMSFWNYLIKKGIMGYQITKPTFDVEPKSQRFAVKMTSGTATFENLFASNRFTATVSVSGLKIYVSDVCITDSYLTDVIDGIQPIKMNMLNPDIRCVDTNGNSYTCVWSSAHNRFEITIPDTDDRTYRVLVTV